MSLAFRALIVSFSIFIDILGLYLIVENELFQLNEYDLLLPGGSRPREDPEEVDRVWRLAV